MICEILKNGRCAMCHRVAQWEPAIDLTLVLVSLEDMVLEVFLGDITVYRRIMPLGALVRIKKMLRSSFDASIMGSMGCRRSS